MVAGSDTWASAPVIGYGSDSSPTPSAGLTTEPGEPFPNGWDLERSAWWRLTAPTSETVGVELFGSVWDTEGMFPDPVVAVYALPPGGSSAADLVLVAHGDDNNRGLPRPGSHLMPDFDFEAVAGTTYWIQAALWSGSADMEYVLRVGKRIETVSAWQADPVYDVTHVRDHQYHALGSIQNLLVTRGEWVATTNVNAQAALGQAYELLDTAYPSSGLSAPDSGLLVTWGWSTIPGTETQLTQAEIFQTLDLRVVSPWNLTGRLPDGDRPAEAIGWEWESAPGVLTTDRSDSTPVGAVLLADSELRTNLRDTSAPGDVFDGTYATDLIATRPDGKMLYSDNPDGSPWPAPTMDRITAWSPNSAEDATLGSYGGATSEGTRTLGSDVDLTDHLDNSGRVVLYTRTSTPVAPHDTEPDNVAINTGDNMEYGWTLRETRIRWSMRPQRYRWRLRTIQLAGVPIRQTSHRDDHLAGGAYQTWPPPQSQQLSNVTSGSYL